jgi:hypothetical protein
MAAGTVHPKTLAVDVGSPRLIELRIAGSGDGVGVQVSPVFGPGSEKLTRRHHAVAFRRHGASLVTADERYYRNARRAGRVLLLQDFIMPTG